MFADLTQRRYRHNGRLLEKAHRAQVSHYPADQSDTELHFDNATPWAPQDLELTEFRRKGSEARCFSQIEYGLIRNYSIGTTF